jgi:hypothetical protein
MGFLEGASQMDMSKDRDRGSEEEGKERLIKLRDTGDDNEMVAVREEGKEEKVKQKRRRSIIKRNE